MEFTYYVCAECGHVETRQSDLEGPRRCENCRSCCEFWTHDTLDAAEDDSQDILDYRRSTPPSRQTHPAYAYAPLRE